jgi:N-acyl homoserine lactone hydrolase
LGSGFEVKGEGFVVTIDLLFKGFPGWSPNYGRIGWASIPLIRAEGRNILFDTGHPGMHRLLLQRLADRGVAPGDVHMVVLSHSHWDHSLGFPIFPNVEVVIGRRELEWALSLAPGDNLSVPGSLMRELADHPRLHAIEGDTEILPGIRMIDTPGHSPGHMSMVATTEAGTVVMAQDAVKNRAEFIAGVADQTMDAAASSASIERVASLGGVVIPGHDRSFMREGSRVVYLEELQVEILATVSPNMEEQSIFTLTFR